MSYKTKDSRTTSGSEHLQQTGVQESTSRSQLLESVALARAALLARRGKLKQAETLLVPIARRLPSRTSALDLLAKVLAQQERMEEAQQVWLRALQIEPCNIHFLRALICCAKSINTQNSSDAS
jgi:Flp pilus assembly protein TadD